jgi:hypothetical protein
MSEAMSVRTKAKKTAVPEKRLNEEQVVQDVMR